MSTDTHYEILDVEPTATAEEIKQRYRKLQRTAHPDVGGSRYLFQKIDEAYAVLRDPASRSAYDESLSASNSAQSPEDLGASAQPGAPAADAPGEFRGADQHAFLREALIAASRAPLAVEPNYYRSTSPQKVAYAAAGAWALVAAATVLAGDGWELMTSIALGAVVLSAASVSQTLSFARPALVHVGSSVLALAAVAGAVEGWIGLPGAALALTASGIAMALVWALRTRARARAFDASAPASLVEGSWSLGRPGDLARDEDERVAAAMTEHVLAPLAAAAQLKVFHGLPRKARQRLSHSVPHAYVMGRSVVLVEGHLWGPGRYGINGHGVVLRDGAPFHGGHTDMRDAVAEYRSALPGCTVVGVVVAHPTASGPAGQARGLDGQPLDLDLGEVRLVSADVAVTTVAGPLLGSAGRVHRPTVLALAGAVKLARR